MLNKHETNSGKIFCEQKKMCNNDKLTAMLIVRNVSNFEKCLQLILQSSTVQTNLTFPNKLVS